LTGYSLGHEVLLFRRRNALLVSSPAEFSRLETWQKIHALREAIWICADTYSARDRFERPSIFAFGFRWNEFKRRRWIARLKNFLPEDYALAEAEFRNYIAAAHAFPPTPSSHAASVLYEKDGDAGGRAFGQPLALTLYQFVLTLPPSERPRCAWDFDFARAVWLYFGHAELEGGYRIENWKERQVQVERDQFEREIAEEKAAAVNAPIAHRPSPESGIATAIPADLKGES